MVWYWRPGGEVVNVPWLIPLVHHFANQYGRSFADDAPEIWNNLPDDVYTAIKVKLE